MYASSQYMLLCIEYLMTRYILYLINTWKLEVANILFYKTHDILSYILNMFTNYVDGGKDNNSFWYLSPGHRELLTYDN